MNLESLIPGPDASRVRRRSPGDGTRDGEAGSRQPAPAEPPPDWPEVARAWAAIASSWAELAAGWAALAAARERTGGLELHLPAGGKGPTGLPHAPSRWTLTHRESLLEPGGFEPLPWPEE